MNFEIKHRWNGSVLFSLECASLQLCVEAAVSAKASLSWANLREANLSGADLSWASLSWADLREANLSGADLREANLSGANLSWANLSGANLREASLSWANLREANLSGADLREASLSWADLREANLSGADLREANLSWANLSWANLSGANLREANLSGANLRGANLRGAVGDFATPEESDAMLVEIAKLVLAKPERLEMGAWHGQEWDATHTPEEERSCGTAHCLAGWAQALCSEPIIRRMDPVRAVVMLIPTAAHMCYKSNAEARAFLQEKLDAAGVRAP